MIDDVCIFYQLADLQFFCVDQSSIKKQQHSLSEKAKKLFLHNSKKILLFFFSKNTINYQYKQKKKSCFIFFRLGLLFGNQKTSQLFIFLSQFDHFFNQLKIIQFPQNFNEIQLHFFFVLVC